MLGFFSNSKICSIAPSCFIPCSFFVKYSGCFSINSVRLLIALNPCSSFPITIADFIFFRNARYDFILGTVPNFCMRLSPVLYVSTAAMWCWSYI